MRSKPQWTVLALTGLAALLAVGVSTANAYIMDDPDFQARWWGPGIPWEIIDNDLGVGDPYWTGGNRNLNVYNICLAPPWHKQVIVEATFTGTAPEPGPLDKDLWLIYHDTLRYDYSQFVVEGSTWTVIWDLPSQQSHEYVRFNGCPWGYNLVTQQTWNIDYLIVATKCVPEPTTLSLIALGGLALLRRRR